MKPQTEVHFFKRLSRVQVAELATHIVEKGRPFLVVVD